MSIFSQRIVQLKKERGLLQKDIADAVGVSLRAYQYYETDGREPTMSVLVSLASYFDVPLDYLVGTGIFKHWDRPEVLEAVKVVLHKSYESLQLGKFLKEGDFQANFLDNPTLLIKIAPALISKIEVQETDPLTVNIYPRIPLTMKSGD